MDHIQIIKKQGGKLTDSYLDEGFILDKKIGTNCPKVFEKGAKILIANTRMFFHLLYYSPCGGLLILSDVDGVD